MGITDHPVIKTIIGFVSGLWTTIKEHKYYKQLMILLFVVGIILALKSVLDIGASVAAVVKAQATQAAYKVIASFFVFSKKKIFNTLFHYINLKSLTSTTFIQGRC